tara:strand:- start:572 stop:1099 length:528 start_codon:yes stop_codon:yes gene_type:complete
MAIIYTYPELTTLQGSDLLLISDTSASNSTKSVTLTNIAAFLAAGGTGTTDTLTMWVDGPAGLIGDSLIAQDAGATTVTITGATVSTGQVTIPLTPVAATDAASKGYVDAEVATFIFEQVIPAATWIITHSLNKYPSVSVVDTANTSGFGAVEYNSANQLTVTFSGAFAGKAYLN